MLCLAEPVAVKFLHAEKMNQLLLVALHLDCCHLADAACNKHLLICSQYQ